MSNDYYRDNLLTTIADLKARVAMLEKALRRSNATPQLDGVLSADIAATLPNAARPPAASIADLPVLVRETGAIYRFESFEIDGRVKLRLVYVGQTRESA